MSDMSTFTLVHVVISVLGIIAGLVMTGGFLAGVRLEGWSAAFLATTALTSATGFGFPNVHVTPAQIVGGLSLAILALAAVARYWRQLDGRWRDVFVIASVSALYFNVFVLIAQLFAKTPALKELAPTQSEPAFALSQLLVLALFVWIGWSAVRGVRRGVSTADIRKPPAVKAV